MSLPRVRRLLGCLAAAATLALLALGQGVPAHAATSASSARPMSLDGTWSCTVPAGYVYDEVVATNRCGSPGFTSYQYHLRLPADGVWSCAGVPTSFTYDDVTTSNLCDPSGFDPNIYRLRVPVNGLWACLVPSGWGYTQVRQSSACGTYSNYIYQLAK